MLVGVRGCAEAHKEKEIQIEEVCLMIYEESGLQRLVGGEEVHLKIAEWPHDANHHPEPTRIEAAVKNA